jgi:hypothetical protein
MRLINKSSGEQYFIDLFEKWWHYPLLALTWFIPHKAYPYKKNNNSIPVKFKFDFKMGIVTGLSFILADIARNLKIFSFSEEYYWIGRVFAYPISLLALIITWRYFSNFLKKKNTINFDKYYIVRLRIFSFKSFKIYFIRLIVIFISMLVIAEVVKYELIGMIVVISISVFLIVLLSITLGGGIGVLSIEGEKLVVE